MRFQFIDDKILGLIMMEMLVKEQGYEYLESHQDKFILCIDCDYKKLTWFDDEYTNIDKIKSLENSDIELRDLIIML